MSVNELRDCRVWLSVPQAMRRGNVFRSTLLSAALLGRVESAVFGGRLFLSAESVDAFRASRERAESESVPAA